MMVCVIADDITGAAEMGGIARRLGLSVCLSLDGQIREDCDVAVIATDTRSMTEEEAVSETKRVLSDLREDHRIKFFFKKTDSALRGHVVAELSAMMEMLGLEGALYLPANPSKKRVISDGRYLIDGDPIDETAFSFDPEFPAFSSRLTERFPDAAIHNIQFSDALGADDIDGAVERAMSENLLLAGAADLFTLFITGRLTGRRRAPAPTHLLGQEATQKGSCIIVCGSTQSDPAKCRVEPSFLPTDVYDGIASADEWTDILVEKYREKPHRVLLAVKDHHRTGRDVAVHLRQTMAHAVSTLTGIRVPDRLIIEGGATSFAILKTLGWNSFKIQEEIAPGVISMLSEKERCVVTMKPGSYPWGGLFCNHDDRQ